MEIVEASDKKKNRAFWQMLDDLGGENGESIKSLLPRERVHKAEDFCLSSQFLLNSHSASSFSNLIRSTYPKLRQVYLRVFCSLKWWQQTKSTICILEDLVHQKKPRKGENRWLRKIYTGWGKKEKRTITGGWVKE